MSRARALSNVRSRAMWQLLCFVALLAPTTAAAGPTVTVQGRLGNLAGQGVDGQYGMTFRLFDAAVEGKNLWQEVLPAVTVQGGVFSAVLGATVTLSAEAVDHPAVWVEVAVGAEPPLTRQRLDAAPLAFVADRARDVACTACVSPEETTFMSGCMDGQILRKQAGVWGCADLVIPTYTGANFALSDQACSAGQVVRGVKPDGTPICVLDKDTTYSGANFAASGQGCAVGQVVNGIGLDGTVTCSPDKDTTYSGANFALSSKTCGSGQVQKGVDSAGQPICVTDANNLYSGTDFALSNRACAVGQYVSGVAADGTPTCAPDKDTTYTGATFALSNRSCAVGQVVKGIDAAGNLVCATDADTTYTGATFALSNKQCAIGQVIRGFDASGNPLCATDANNTYTGANFALSNTLCAAGQYQRGTDASGNPVCAALKDFINSSCYVYFGWIDSCGGCTNPPTKFGRVNDTGCTTNGTDNYCALFTLPGITETIRMLGINTDGTVNDDDKFYVGFKCL
jgi:hypothetical protein